MSNKRLVVIAALAALAALAGSACHHQGTTSSPDAGSGDAGIAPFQADPPAVYVAKVKDILVGLAPTDAEVATVVANPANLSSLIDNWIKMPQYQEKMKVFFEQAFQQTQITSANFVDMAPTGINGSQTNANLLVQNAQESFARTVLAQIGQAGPFNQVITTKQLAMTAPLMMWYAYLETVHTEYDSTKPDAPAVVTDTFATLANKPTIYIESAAGPIPLSESVDPTSPNYMHFYDPGVASLVWSDPTCVHDPLVYSPTTSYSQRYGSYVLQNWMFGRFVDDGTKSATGVYCQLKGGTPKNSPFTAADFATWKTVNIRPPNAGESITKFWDADGLRNATEVVLNTARVGFFSTPAFHANWSTNQSNQMRVTTNQALIVATGMAVDGTDPTIPPTTPGLDAEHAAPGSPCFVCHQTLDPTRSILQATWSWAYSNQSDPALLAQKGNFQFQGVIKPVSTVDDFANILATHPAFPTAWAQKLCYFANSAPCDTTDPEFQRIATDFQNSGYQWDTLVRELLSSPITTNTVQTPTTAANGEVIAVARRDELCQALDNRLNLTDACGLDLTVPKTGPTVIQQIVGGLPSDGYGRGSIAPVLPNQPTMFYRAGVENICEAVATEVVDVSTPNPNQPNAKNWSSAQPDAAIADMVATMLGFTSTDPRTAQAQQILKQHFTQAMGKGQTATSALQSTFVVSCLSPSFIGIGM